MSHLILVAFGVTALIAVGTNAATPLEFGMEMSTRSYDAVCWYENLKQFPKTHSKDYNKCAGKQKFQMNQIMTNDFFVKNADKKEEYFGKWSEEKVIVALPAPYKEACTKYLKDAKAEPPADESDTLNDGGNKYPYKAYAYCLMMVLRKEHGDEANEAVKNERTHTKKHWMKTLNDRENEFRARHSSEPLQLSDELNSAAQKWADTMASECKSYHSKNTDAGRQWRGNGTGESLSAGGGEDENDIAAYQAADGWYEEIQDYPYPGGYDGNNDALFKKIGHFTQSVWKGSKYVGYGYAYKADCKPFTRYVVARYSPAGNMKGKYPENVNPPKD